jgi:hypothetical protein
MRQQAGALGILAACAVLMAGTAARAAYCDDTNPKSPMRSGQVTLRLHANAKENTADDGMRSYFVQTDSDGQVEGHVISANPKNAVRSIDVFDQWLDGNLDLYKHGIGIHLYIEDKAKLPATIVVDLRQRCALRFYLYGEGSTINDLNYPSLRSHPPDSPGGHLPESK